MNGWSGSGRGASGGYEFDGEFKVSVAWRDRDRQLGRMRSVRGDVYVAGAEATGAIAG